MSVAPFVDLRGATGYARSALRRRASDDGAPRRSRVSIEFLITALVVVASPGTGVLYTLAAGLSRGSRASVVAAFGCTLGIVPHMAATIMGLAASADHRQRVS